MFWNTLSGFSFHFLDTQTECNQSKCSLVHLKNMCCAHILMSCVSRSVDPHLSFAVRPLSLKLTHDRVTLYLSASVRTDWSIPLFFSVFCCPILCVYSEDVISFSHSLDFRPCVPINCFDIFPFLRTAVHGSFKLSRDRPGPPLTDPASDFFLFWILSIRLEWQAIPSYNRSVEC